MKTICIGDVHGDSTWLSIATVHSDADRFIFIGDYFDTHFDITGLEQLQNFEKICQFKRTQLSLGKQVILLIGNHDIHYFPEIGYTGTSGYQSKMKIVFENAIRENRDLLQMCFEDENNVFYTHAGISSTWLRDVGLTASSDKELCLEINELFKVRPSCFNFYNGDFSGYGQNVHQSPIWIRPESLYKDQINKLQVVGHTSVTKINHPPKSERRGFYLIDAIACNNQKQYLSCVNGQFNIETIS